MKTQKKLSAKLIFTKQTVAKLNEETMALLRGGAGNAEGFNPFGLMDTSQVCGSTGHPLCNTVGDNTGLSL